jgi:hypothetical protein
MEEQMGPWIRAIWNEKPLLPGFAGGAVSALLLLNATCGAGIVPSVNNGS